MIPEVKVKGVYHVDGRGTILTADRRDHDFEILDFKKGGQFIANGKEWVVNHLECFRRWDRDFGPIVGICARELKGKNAS